MSSMTPESFRESFLSFYEGKGHTRHPSDGLVPQDDPTLLFTGAGMNQFKAEFMGKGRLPFTRATTTQKCLRMPDLENVGRTASHHTFFEMLGNFSFGDYFKAEAIAWAWEFLGQIGLPADRLSVTVYKDDDEAAALWADEIGVPPERIFRCDEDENFWPASAPSKGPNGICGPCSEIYFDYHPERGAYPAEGPGEDGARFVEIWNLVFTQFDRQPDGELAPLPNKNIDTGMGFERVVRVLESLERGEILASNFETRLFAPLMEAIHGHVGRDTQHGTPEGERTRRIADHVRAAAFCIADGVRPSNEKQGYVVRKVLRRAMLDRHMLGGDLRTPWLAQLAGTVVDHMGGAWPELSEARGLIESTIAGEEEKFAGAFLSGSQRLHVLAEQQRQSGGTQLPGPEAFLLYDTFGLPLDMQKALAEEEGLGIDEEGFAQAMAEQRRRSREGSKISDAIFDEGPLAGVSEQLPETEFVRDTLDLEGAQLLAVVDDEEGEESSGEGRAVVAILDRTPFYTEGGGQVGDRGELIGEDFRIEVDDVVGLRGLSLHRGVLVEGEASTGTVRARVDAVARAATARHHTATHLLHAALREVLGDEVTQAGSLVTPDRLRFDFRFPRALSEQEVEAVEDRVNSWILGNEAVQSEEMGRDAAREAGAMALFGEKYGDVVRVVRVPDSAEGRDSVELCGGTHVRRSGDIGLFRVLAESSIAAGIRRVEARAGASLLELLREDTRRLESAAALFKAAPDKLVERIGALQDELKSTRKELEAARGDLVGGRIEAALAERDGLRVGATTVHGVPVKTLRDLAGKLVKGEADVLVLAVPEESGTSFLAAVGKTAQKQGWSARELVASLGEALGGKGGGSPGFAQGKGGPAEDLDGLLARVLAGGAQAAG